MFRDERAHGDGHACRQACEPRCCRACGLHIGAAPGLCCCSTGHTNAPFTLYINEPDTRCAYACEHGDVCIHARGHARARTHAHARMSMHAQTRTHGHTRTGTHHGDARKYQCVSKYVSMHAHKCAITQEHTCTQARNLRTRTRACAHARTAAHVCTHACTCNVEDCGSCNAGYCGSWSSTASSGTASLKTALSSSRSAMLSAAPNDAASSSTRTTRCIMAMWWMGQSDADGELGPRAVEGRAAPCGAESPHSSTTRSAASATACNEAIGCGPWSTAITDRYLNRHLNRQRGVGV